MVLFAGGGGGGRVCGRVMQGRGGDVWQGAG